MLCHSALTSQWMRVAVKLEPLDPQDLGPGASKIAPCSMPLDIAVHVIVGIIVCVFTCFCWLTVDVLPKIGTGSTFSLYLYACLVVE